MGITQIIPALGLLNDQRPNLTDQAVLNPGRIAIILQFLLKPLKDAAAIHHLSQQKSAAITAGFSPAQLDRNRWVACWFPGRYCFTHGERSPLIKFLRNMLIIKDKPLAFFVY